jgi:ketosteroid isomerase-like protein
MRVSRFRLVQVVGLLVVSAQPLVAQRPASTDTVALRGEIEQLNRGMEAAVNRGDLLAAAAFYADDATVRTANGVDARGRGAIDGYFQGLANAKSWKLDLIQVGGTRDVAYEVGKSTLVHGQPERTSIVYFVVVWKRQPNGQLKIILDYYHSARPGS